MLTLTEEDTRCEPMDRKRKSRQNWAMEADIRVGVAFEQVLTGSTKTHRAVHLHCVWSLHRAH